MIVSDGFIADANRLGVADMHGRRFTTGELLWRKGPVVGGVVEESSFYHKFVCLAVDNTGPRVGDLRGSSF